MPAKEEYTKSSGLLFRAKGCREPVEKPAARPPPLVTGMSSVSHLPEPLYGDHRRGPCSLHWPPALKKVLRAIRDALEQINIFMEEIDQ